MHVMRVASRIHDYEVRFSERTDFVADLDQLANRFYVIDANVWRLYGETVLRSLDRDLVLVLPAEEQRKTVATVLEIYDALLARTAKKNMTLISIGGGIVQDVTGYAASTLYRGVRWVYVPTTLLAQADSCIGAKTSLNYKGYKNIAGTFYPPHEVYVSAAFLDSLSEADFYSGLGEVIKLHLMGGEASTHALIDDLAAVRRREPQAVMRAIRRSLDVKLGYIQDDEFDSGRRNLLNFGHCFGHALEATSSFAVPHGQAVLIGILFANSVAQGRGVLSTDLAAFLNRCLLADNVVAQPAPSHLDVACLFDAMQKDKKRTGAGLPLVLLTDGYRMTKVDDLTCDELAAAANKLASLFEQG